MVYTFELIKHPNVHYRDAVVSLSRCELLSMLRALKAECPVEAETLGGSPFLVFECRELSSRELAYLSGHSSVSFMAERVRGPLLRPLDVPSASYLPEDLPEILKYKGKTSVPFTRMMINTAAALTPWALSPGKMTFFDPVCGRGTGCFCALCAGMDAVGLDQSSRDLKEASDYFARYLKYGRMKHQVRSRSETVRKTAVQVTEFTFADTKEHYQAGETRRLTFACADTSLSPALFRRTPAHVIAADLPYGIQHAPRADRKPETLTGFLKRALPAWKQSLVPGGAIALSYNTLTLPDRAVLDAVRSAGLIPAEESWMSGLSHEVEQAVVRNVIFAVNPEEETT